PLSTHGHSRPADEAIVIPSPEIPETLTLPLHDALPILRGTARSTFSFKIQVRNEGSEDGLFNLAAHVPNGFQTRFKKGYGSEEIDRKSTRLNSSHVKISYAVFSLKKKIDARDRANWTDL